MNLQSHKSTEAIVISCIDFRFHQTLKEALKKEKIGSFDLLTLAGGAKNLSNPLKKYYRETATDNIEIAHQLHQVKTVVLCNHIDCGAYGGSSQHKNLKEEIKFHWEELKKAEIVVKKIFPNLKVKTILLELKK